MQRKLEANANERELEDCVNLSIQWNRWILKLIGVWPNFNNASVVQRYAQYFLNAVCYFLILFRLLAGSLYTIFEVQDVYKRIKMFGPLIFCMMAFFKYYLLNCHGSSIRDCVERIERDWRNVSHSMDRDVMINNANFGRRLVFVCTLFMYSGFAFFHVALPLKVGRVPAGDDLNFTFIPITLPFPRIILDTRYSPTNELCFAVQVLSGIATSGITSAACSLAAAFAVHACGQMQVMMNWLEHLVDGRSDMSDSVDKRIAEIVGQHVRILKFLSLIETTLHQVSCVEFLGCTFDICLLGYYIITEWKSNNLANVVTYLVLLVSLTFNIFIFCYIGELVASQCNKIGETTYMIEWYRLRGKKKHCCILIIAMSNSSIKLTAGNMVELSMNTFSNVVKTSSAFLNVLRTLT